MHLFLLLAILLFASPIHAGCGCDKPPPLPSVVVPEVSYYNGKITLHHSNFRAGHVWQVKFTNGRSDWLTSATVVDKKSLTNGGQLSPQLVVTVPNVDRGPTSITLSRTGMLPITVPSSEFTITGAPMAMPTPNTATTYTYSAATGTDGLTYLAMSGLQNICQALDLTGVINNWPLTYGPGDIQIINAQGFHIETLDAGELGHFGIDAGSYPASNMLSYSRHSFAQYCADHQPGGIKAVSGTDPDWHVDNTPHTRYDALIFIIDGKINGATPTAGARNLSVTITTSTP